MLKSYIVEDEAKAIRLLEKYVEQIDFLELVGSARSAEKAFDFLQKHQVDILFLDINLPDSSGIALYEKLSLPPAVIFTTAYPEFAVQGFDLEAIDYILKPITFLRFLKASKRALKQYRANESSVPSMQNFPSDIVYIKSGTLLHKVSWQDILYLEKDENYVIYHTPEKRILSRQTLNDLEVIFPNYFVRIHKSYAVSLLHIEQVSRENIKVKKHTLPIGRTYKASFLERL